MKTFTQTFTILFLLLTSLASFGKMDANFIELNPSQHQKNQQLHKEEKSVKNLKKFKKTLKWKETKNFLGDFIRKFMWTLVVILIAALGVKIVQYGLLNLLNPAVAGGLFIGIGLGIILLAVIGFFIIYPDLLWFT